MNCTWGWRKLLQLRDEVRPFIWSKLGDGQQTSMWFDRWTELCSLSRYITPRQITQAGFQLTSKVADLYNGGEWNWPTVWLDLFPVLINMPPIVLNANHADSIVWKDMAGDEHIYSSKVAWDSLRFKDDEVCWANSVWFPHCIPRHAFLMWLIVKQKLKTQDKIMQWKASYNLYCCSLCKGGPDSHAHLFFECLYSSQVWKGIKVLAEVPQMTNSWEDIMHWLVSKASSRSVKKVIGRLLVAATAYFLWQERNARLFTTHARPPDKIVELIVSTVRHKLVTLRFKNTATVDRLLKAWNIPSGIVDNIR